MMIESLPNIAGTQYTLVFSAVITLEERDAFIGHGREG